MPISRHGLVGAAAAAVALAGCGSSGGSGTDPESGSTAQVNAICRQAIASASARELPTTETAIIQVQSKAARTFGAAADRIASLPLDAQQKEWLAQFREIAAANGEAARAARQDGVESDAFLKAGRRYEEAAASANAAATSAGLDECRLGSVTNGG